MTNVSSPLPGSPFTPRHVRILKISVAILTVLLLAGIVALVFGVVRQAKKLTASPPPPAQVTGQSPYSQSLDLGQGRLEGVLASGDFLIFYWKGEGSDTVLTINPRNGYEVGRIQVPRR